MRIDGIITFAAAFSKPCDIQHGNSSAVIFDEAYCLQSVSDKGHARPPHTEHLRQELLRERKLVTLHQVPDLQKPPAQALFQRMRCVARRHLLYVCLDYLL